MSACNKQPDAGCFDWDNKLNSLQSTVDLTPQHKALVIQTLSHYPETIDNEYQFGECKQNHPCDESQKNGPSASSEHHDLLFTRTLVQAVCFEAPDVVSSIQESYRCTKIVRLENGRTVLMFAVMRENLFILDRLLQTWPQMLDCQDDSGCTALFYCIKFSKLKSANWLLSKGCDFDATDLLGQTPLHLAAQLDQMELFLALKARGASITTLDIYGRFPTDYLKDQKLKTAINKEYGPEILEIKDNSLRRKYHYKAGLIQTPKMIPNIASKVNPYYHDNFTEQAFRSLIKERTCPDQAISPPQLISRKRAQKKDLQRQREFKIKLLPCLLEVKDLVVEAILGGGENNPNAISRTYCVRHNSDHYDAPFCRYLAVKEYPKRLMLSSDRLKYLQIEKKALMNFQHPFIVKLESCFQSEEKVYIATEFCPKGDLGGILQKRLLSLAETQVLAAELILAIEALHQQGFSHRDLKPENVLIGADGHVRLADFGMCHQKQKLKPKRGFPPHQKSQSQKKEHPNTVSDLTSTFCGTLVYIPPEVLTHKKYKGSAVDWYLLGEVLFEAVFGYPPYIDQSKDAIKANILEGKLLFPDGDGNSAFRDLVAQLLAKCPEERLGYSQGGQEIKIHPFFLGVDFEKISKKEILLFDPTTLEDIHINHIGLSLEKATKRLGTLHNQKVLKELDSNKRSSEGQSEYSSFTDSESEDHEQEYLELRGWSFAN